MIELQFPANDETISTLTDVQKDFIRYRVKADYDALCELGCPVYYEEAKGLAHEWDFWDLYLRKALYEWLPLKREPIYEE